MEGDFNQFRSQAYKLRSGSCGSHARHGGEGVEILSCGTCLERFGLVDQIKVGRITNMFEVVESLNSATKIISPG